MSDQQTNSNSNNETQSGDAQGAAAPNKEFIKLKVVGQVCLFKK